MPWASKAKAILQTWFAGQEFGNALVDVITGKINPSGKLPTSFPINIEDTPAFKSYPGKNLQMDYEEKLLIGYRWYDRRNIDLLFPFGHGLSYSKFKYSDLRVKIQDTKKVSCKFFIENIGEIAGAEVAQCYISRLEADDHEPLKTLQGFQKKFLHSNEKMEFEIKLTPRNFSQRNIEKKEWGIKHGSYQILIGSSSAEIFLEEKITL
jgi:beta-glucosidase